jgi:hypothetical protein
MDICCTGKERKKEGRKKRKKERGYNKINMVLVIQNLQWLSLCISLYFS